MNETECQGKREPKQLIYPLNFCYFPVPVHIKDYLQELSVPNFTLPTQT